MKKLSLLLIAVMCCFTLTACGPRMKIIQSATEEGSETSEVVVIDDSEEESEEESTEDTINETAPEAFAAPAEDDFSE